MYSQSPLMKSILKSVLRGLISLRGFAHCVIKVRAEQTDLRLYVNAKDLIQIGKI